MPRRPVLAAAVTLTLFAAGCSSSGSGGGSAKAGAPSGATRSGVASTSSSSSGSGTASGLSIRYVNLFTVKGAPGPAVDIIEGQPGQHTTVLVHDLAYGAVGDYVHPHLVPDVPAGSQGKYVMPLYAIPSGEDPAAHPSDAHSMPLVYDDGSHAQVTLLLDGDPDGTESGPLSGLRVGTRLERGTFNGQTTPDVPAARTTELLADGSAPAFAGATDVGQTYLLIDKSCTPATNAASGKSTGPAIVSTANLTATKGLFALFPLSAGSHQLAVSASSTCPSSAGQGTTSVTLTAGQQVEVFVYGLSAKSLHLVTAPVGA